MAKVKGMAATKYIGSLGPQVFYMRNGQNIVREKAASVSNPQTTAQMDQRVKMGNIINLYRLNKAWTEKYAFPLRPAKQSVYNAFMSANLTGSEVALTKEQYRAGVTVLEPLDFTKGNLRQMRLEYDDDTAFISELVITEDISQMANVGLASQHLLDNNSWLRNRDQLSIIFNVTDSNGYGNMVAVEFTIDVDGTQELSEFDFFDYAGIDDAGATKYLNFSFDSLPNNILSDAQVIGAVFVVSRETPDGIAVTTSRMELNTYSVLNTYNTDAARRAARRSYGGGDVAPFLVPGSDSEGGSTISVPVRLSDFTWPIRVSQLDENTTITLTNGMTGEDGLRYLTRHLTFSIQGGGIVSIDSEASETENEYYLSDGSDRLNDLIGLISPGVYAFASISHGPTLTAAMWDGVQFDPAV